MLSLKRIFAIFSGISLIFCSTHPRAAEVPVSARYPEWAKNAVIYEVNIRQHTPEGTFKALEKDLPRLKELGVDILWLMPVFPIGEKERKGKLGSYYSVKDYQGLNPEFGGESDFRSLVDNAHKLGLKVILDWVANHSAWDNPWMTQHPEWYKKDSSGKFLSPYDWTDVVSLDYKNQAMRKAMTESMKYWVEKFDIDGFRCDVAGLVPVDFWEQARPALQEKKPLFFLAEDEETLPLFNKAFDMGYGWRMHWLMSKVAKGSIPADSILKFQKKIGKEYPKDAIRMNFVTNHDENSWSGTVREKFGAGGRACAVLTYTLPGMPLIYSGQEAGLDKRLKFFEKDTINWSDKGLYPFYQALNKLKHDNKALWNPPYSGEMDVVKTSEPQKVISFIREAGEDEVFVMINMTDKPVKVILDKKTEKESFKDIFSGKQIDLKPGAEIELKPWEYLLGVGVE